MIALCDIRVEYSRLFERGSQIANNHMYTVILKDRIFTIQFGSELCPCGYDKHINWHYIPCIINIHVYILNSTLKKMGLSYRYCIVTKREDLLFITCILCMKTIFCLHVYKLTYLFFCAWFICMSLLNIQLTICAWLKISVWGVHVFNWLMCNG